MGCGSILVLKNFKTTKTAQWHYSKEQKAAVKNALKKGVGIKEILCYFYPEVSADKMKKVWNLEEE